MIDADYFVGMYETLQMYRSLVRERLLYGILALLIPTNETDPKFNPWNDVIKKFKLGDGELMILWWLEMVKIIS